MLVAFVAIFPAARGAFKSHMLLGPLSPFTTNCFRACRTGDRASQIGLIGATFVFDGQAQCSILVRVHGERVRSRYQYSEIAHSINPVYGVPRKGMEGPGGWGRGAESPQPRD